MTLSKKETKSSAKPIPRSVTSVVDEVTSISDVIPPSPPVQNNFTKYILVMVILGLALAGGIMYMVSQVSVAPVGEVVPQPVKEQLFLTIDQKNEPGTSIEDELFVSGKTLPHAIVMVYSDTDDTSTEADEKGIFESTVLLAKGENLIRITAYNDDGEEKSETISVTPTNE